MLPLRTARLDLVPASLTLVEADLESPETLGRLLRAAVPASWPPGEYDRSAMEFFRAKLLEDDAYYGWLGWYAIRRAVADDPPVVIGAGGYLGPPDADGVVEVGYSIAPEFRERGFATELVQALVARAFSQPGVALVRAHTTESNVGSVLVLERCGFARIGAGVEPGTLRYERTRLSI